MLKPMLFGFCAAFCLMTAEARADLGEVKIEDFAFLTGYWDGTGFGDRSEEMWMPPSGGRMFGIFKQHNNGELQFSEFMEISENESGWALRLKHFNPDFSGWEAPDEHVTFRLESLSDNEAVFGGLRFELVAPDNLRIALRLRQDDGSLTTEVFEFRRVDM